MHRWKVIGRKTYSLLMRGTDGAHSLQGKAAETALSTTNQPKKGCGLLEELLRTACDVEAVSVLALDGSCRAVCSADPEHWQKSSRTGWTKWSGKALLVCTAAIPNRANSGLHHGPVNKLLRLWRYSIQILQLWENLYFVHHDFLINALIYY